MTDPSVADTERSSGVFGQRPDSLPVSNIPMPVEQTAVEVFCSYSHADEALWGELEKHLEVLRRTGLIKIWSDRAIGVGEQWAGAIDSHLESAQFILLLISADFLASKYCMDVEVIRAIERHHRGEARVVPIVLRPVDWLGHPLSQFQALPTHARPVTEWASRDEAFRAVAIGLREMIERFQHAKQPIAPPPTSLAGPWSATLPSLDTEKIRSQWLRRCFAVIVAVGLSLYWVVEAWRRPTPAEVPQVHQNSVDHLNYVRLPPGSFVRGCRAKQPACNPDAQPATAIRSETYFWMGQTPVTILAYQNYVKATTPGANQTPIVYSLGLDHPIVNVTWQDANNYCQWAGGRLPFEWEWEFGAKGGPAGKESVGWYSNDSGSGTRRVATVPPNGWLLYDTLGNVWEWCLDWYDATYYAHSPNVSPLGPDTGSRRVIRGGSWKDEAGTIFPHTRNSLPPKTSADNVGFRCIIDNPSSAF
jgi:formylglycine-generating enzyme required for sulfatase activity